MKMICRWCPQVRAINQLRQGKMQRMICWNQHPSKWFREKINPILKAFTLNLREPDDEAKFMRGAHRGAMKLSLQEKVCSGHQCKLQESQKTVRHCRQSGPAQLGWRIQESCPICQALEGDADERTWKLLTDENRRPRSVREPLNRRIVSQDLSMPVDVDGDLLAKNLRNAR